MLSSWVFRFGFLFVDPPPPLSPTIYFIDTHLAAVGIQPFPVDFAFPHNPRSDTPLLLAVSSGPFLTF